MEMTKYVLLAIINIVIGLIVIYLALSGRLKTMLRYFTISREIGRNSPEPLGPRDFGDVRRTRGDAEEERRAISR